MQNHQITAHPPRAKGITASQCHRRRPQTRGRINSQITLRTTLLIRKGNLIQKDENQWIKFQMSLQGFIQKRSRTCVTSQILLRKQSAMTTHRTFHLYKVQNEPWHQLYTRDFAKQIRLGQTLVTEVHQLLKIERPIQ